MLRVPAEGSLSPRRGPKVHHHVGGGNGQAVGAVVDLNRGKTKFTNKKEIYLRKKIVVSLKIFFLKIVECHTRPSFDSGPTLTSWKGMERVEAERCRATDGKPCASMYGIAGGGISDDSPGTSADVGGEGGTAGKCSKSKASFKKPWVSKEL